MSLVSFFDIVAVAASIFALTTLVASTRKTPRRPEILIFALIIILTVFHDGGNLLEWAGITNMFDPVEDYLEVLTAALWAFFLYTYLQEITEQRLKEVQELDEKILDGSPVAFVLRNSDMKIIRVSKAFEKVTGYDSSRVVGKRTEDFMPDIAGRAELISRLTKVLETGLPLGPTEVKAPSPVPRYIREMIFPVVDAKGRVTNTLSVLEDITAQTKAERKLREIQELDEKILDGSPVAFVLHDLEMRILRVSSAYERVTGLRASEVLGRTFDEFIPPGPMRDENVMRLRYVQERGVQVGPQEIESFAGGRFIRETILPIFDENRKVINTLTVMEDISEQKRARDALQESEARYKMLFDNLHDGVVLHEMHPDGSPGRFLEVNSRFGAMTGYTKSELLEMTPADLLEGSSLEDEEAVREDLLDGYSAFLERTLITRTGGRLPCEFNSHAIFLGGKRVVLSVLRDISERKEAQDRIQSSLAEKETLLREVHHRVKNNLQVISGLLNLQSHYIDDEGVRTIYKESQNRIKTMALIHEELYQRKDLARINLSDYINGLARNLMASYSMASDRISLILDLESVDIALDTAIPCGLIVNEIVSNSLTHAFPGNRRGKIKITFRTLAPLRYELILSDNGIGLPEDLDIMKSRSLGLRLVSVLSEQLGADMEVKGEQGTYFRLAFNEYLEAGTEVY